MEKVKIMLITIAVLAFAGGTLAFKSKYGTEFCTTTAFYHTVAHTYYCPPTLHCPNLLAVFEGQTNPSAQTVCYTRAIEGTCVDEEVTLTCLTTTQPSPEP